MKKLAITALLGLLLSPVSYLNAADHPKEHPSEHPKEHPAAAATSAPVAPAPTESKVAAPAEAAKPAAVAAPALAEGDFKTALDEWLKKKTAKTNGALAMTVAKEKLQLTLEKFHHDKWMKLDGGKMAVCADFKGANGKSYDLDFVGDGTDPKKIKFKQPTVHKIDGVEKHTWKEEKGLWVKEKIKAPKKAKKAKAEKAEEKK